MPIIFLNNSVPLDVVVVSKVPEICAHLFQYSLSVNSYKFINNSDENVNNRNQNNKCH